MVRAASQMLMRVIGAPPRAIGNLYLQRRAGLGDPARRLASAPSIFSIRGESAERGSGARSDSFISAVKVVPSQGLHVRGGGRGRRGVPIFELVLLRCAHRPAHDLKKCSWGRRGWPSCIPTETPITVAAPRVASRGGALEQGATSPPSARHRVPISTGSKQARGKAQLARMASTRLPCCEHHGFARVQVRGHHGKRNAEIFKPARFEKRVRLNSQRDAGLLAKPSRENAPSSDVPKSGAYGRSQ